MQLTAVCSRKHWITSTLQCFRLCPNFQNAFLFTACPSYPHGITLLNCDGHSMTLGWKAPRYSGGSPVLGYYIDKREANHQNWHEVNSSLITRTIYTVGTLQSLFFLTWFILFFFVFGRALLPCREILSTTILIPCREKMEAGEMTMLSVKLETRELKRDRLRTDVNVLVLTLKICL